MEAPSSSNGNAFCTVKSSPFTLTSNIESKNSSVIRTKAEQSFGRFAAERRRAESHAASGPLRHNEL
jgi:hypothetical protein